MSYDFDLFVIGAGSGGIASARRATEYGAKVGIAEFDRLGGTCVNRGCIPKKLMVYASHFPSLFEESQGYGWSPVESELDWTKMITAVNGEVDRLNGVYQRMLDKSEVKLYQGYAEFVDPHTLKIGEDTVTADKILIAVGGKPVKPDIPGIEHTLISDQIFQLTKQPKRVVILGGGYIGVEFACILHGLGTEVTEVIRREHILHGFDGDIRTHIQSEMERHGVRILNKSVIKLVEKTDEGLAVTIARENEEEIIIADAVGISATGRRPNLEKLGLDKVGITVEKGAIAVDANSCTNIEHIYAVGDCTDRVNLTPVAIGEGRAFSDTHFGGKSRQMSYDNIPTAVFSNPEAGTVGLTEEEARTQYGDKVKIYRAKFRPLYHTVSGQEDRTLMKLVVNEETDKVLGAHMVGEHAGEIIQGVAISLKMGATKANFDATVGIHPSSAEEFVTMR
ncbi:MAG: glutathione-disulfide reductase [Roseofilum sp. SID2]|uniref:glutathione-disulfide reductase n=1 Tax=unclassified Roseofilum TaxID=2620099 RepID=UPI001B06FC0C|nr:MULTISPECIES: glutathione-disulfide reductase [unclassified Roseofilum]MBP0023517.1 glutathione-disulfide reductase [Roseofilum sp. SID2]MBP0039654.1 glutathione-disulfide reductase [Roseofilum sp. SID1]